MPICKIKKKDFFPANKGFTLLELMIVVAIIIIVAVVVLVSINSGRKSARLNSTKTTLRSVLTTLVSCGISGGAVSAPNSGTQICNKIPNAEWPSLPGGYVYVAGGDYSYMCNFQVSTGGDSASNLICDCLDQRCR